MSLKQKNESKLSLVLVGNLACFHILANTGSLTAGDLAALVENWAPLLPAALVLALVKVVNGWLPAEIKAMIVFWRVAHVLPGHRAFTEIGPDDPRVDMGALAAAFGPLPTDPGQQNRLWYRMLKQVEGDPGVAGTHQDFLFSRDYAAIALLCVGLLGPAAAMSFGSGWVALGYALLLLGQYMVVRIAGEVYGTRLVATVLSVQSVQKPQARAG